jgi:O-antigen ligase
VCTVFFSHLFAGAFDNQVSIIVATVVLAISAIGYIIWRKDSSLFDSKSIWIAALLFAVPLLVALVQTLTPGFDREYALMAFVRLWGLGSVFSMACLIGYDPARQDVFKSWLCVAILIFSAFSLVHFHLLVRRELPLPLFTPRGRLISSFFSANSAALELSLALMTAGGVAIAEFRERRPNFSGTNRESLLGWVAALAAALSLVALALTRSRSGIFLTAATPALGLLIFRAKTRKRFFYMGLPAAVLALCVMLASLFTRLGATAGDFGGRMDIYRAHLQAAIDRPILGHGFGAFAFVSRSQINELNFLALYNVGAMHNVYLQWLEQAGFIATGTMLATYAWVMIKLFSHANIGRRTSVYWVRAALLCMGVALGQGLLDFGFEHYSIVLMMALIVGSAFGICLRRDGRKYFAQARTEHRSSRAGSGSVHP